MIKSYLYIVFRYMVRHKVFSLINLFGLTIGIACSLLIILYVNDELTFDTFHPDANRMYRIGFEGKLQGKEIRSAYTGAPLATALQRQKDVQSVVRLASWATFPMRYGDKTFTEPNLLLADSNFFRFFNFKLIEGHVDRVLQRERDIVITASTAKRYFGDQSPLGKTLVLAQGYTATVTGIAEDPPPNSHFHFTFILSMKSWDEAGIDNWTTGKVITYVKLNPGVSQSSLDRVLRQFVDTYVNSELEQLRKVNIDQFSSQGNRLGFFIQPLLDIHLRSALSDEIESNGNIQYLYLFGAIAIFIILLACINFMNLSTARSASRAKEVGVRKTVGAPTSRLMGQFLIESYFYIIIAVCLALFIVAVALTPFNYFTGKQLSFGIFFEPAFLAGLIALVAIVGILAGSYPAFYLTMFSPIDVMKGRVRSRLRSYGIRNALVVFQFLISAGLIIATLVLYLQLRHVQTINLGFDKENIINLLHTKNLGNNGKVFKDELLKNPAIVSASYSNRLPPNIDWRSVFTTTNPKKDYILAVYEMDYDHVKTMQYKMAAGRFFSPDFPADTASIVLNETAAEKLGFTRMEQQKLRTLYGNTTVEREVIGILHDFNFQSLRDTIQPMAVVLGAEPNWEMAIRIRNENQETTLEFIHTLWKKYSPNAPFEYTFLDKNFAAKHNTERRIGILFSGFTILAIVIACLGLFGLATFTAEQRTKEIGIRKVLGATEGNIVNLLNRDFLRLVLVANLIAWPITWWLMNSWLTQFAYHVRQPWWVFVIAGLVTFLIALLAVSLRAFKAAQGNPVNSLRDE